MEKKIKFKVGDKIEIFKKPTTWDSKYEAKYPLELKFPKTIVLKRIIGPLNNQSGICEEGYGWDLKGLIDEKNFKFINKDFSLPKKKFTLPKKWCIKALKISEAEFISKYANPLNQKYNGSSYTTSDALRYYLLMDKDIYQGASDILEYHPDYKLITFKQFKKYVLSSKNKKMKSVQKNKNIIGYKLKEKFKQYENIAANIAFNSNVYNSFSNQHVNFQINSTCFHRIQQAGLLNSWFEPIYEKIIVEKPIMIGDYEVIINPKGIVINGVIYPKRELIFLKRLMKKDQIKSLRVGCKGQYKFDEKLLDKILDKFNK